MEKGYYTIYKKVQFKSEGSEGWSDMITFYSPLYKEIKDMVQKYRKVNKNLDFRIIEIVALSKGNYHKVIY